MGLGMGPICGAKWIWDTLFLASHFIEASHFLHLYWIGSECHGTAAWTWRKRRVTSTLKHAVGMRPQDHLLSPGQESWFEGNFWPFKTQTYKWWIIMACQQTSWRWHETCLVLAPVWRRFSEARSTMTMAKETLALWSVSLPRAFRRVQCTDLSLQWLQPFPAILLIQILTALWLQDDLNGSMERILVWDVDGPLQRLQL